MSAARQALKAIAMKKELEKVQAESGKSKAKAARKEKTRRAKVASLNKLRAVQTLEEPRTSATDALPTLLVSHGGSSKKKDAPNDNFTETQQDMIERAEQRLARRPEWFDTPPKERARKLAEQTSLSPDLVIACLAKKAPDEYDSIKRGSATKTAAQAKIKALTKANAMNRLADAAKHKEPDQGEDPAASDLGRKNPDPLPARAHPAGSLTGVNGLFFDEYIRYQLEELNRFHGRPYEIDRKEAGFSCRAHLRHRTGHFSFSLLATLGARKKALEAVTEATPEHTLPDPQRQAKPPHSRASASTQSTPAWRVPSAALSDISATRVSGDPRLQKRKGALSESDLPALSAAQASQGAEPVCRGGDESDRASEDRKEPSHPDAAHIGPAQQRRGKHFFEGASPHAPWRWRWSSS